MHHITTTSEENGNAFGISVYGTSKTPITQLVISGNEVYQLRTGESESVNVMETLPISNYQQSRSR